ncbi:MAG: AMP-binding protein [Phycisphaerae bacterium SM23_30]|nr:MAG: AMP-binding protein [Phycisphaerae bacterium SM23_30]
MNVAHNLESAAFHFPEKVAVIEGDRKVSFAEFDRDANRIAAAMVGAGAQPGDHIALCAPNSYQWLVFYFGALKVGSVAVTFSHSMMQDELLKVLEDCKPKIMLVADEKMDDLKKCRIQSYPELIVSDSGDIPYARFVEKGTSGFPTVQRHRHDTAAILYTGGTTGTSKGAMLSHENLQTSLFNVARNERSTEHDRALCFLPLNHVFAQVHIMHSTVLSGGGLVIQGSFDLERVLEAIDRHQATKFYAVPTVYIRLLEVPNLREKIRSIRYCFSAAASMATEVVREWKTQTGLNIYEAYGMTESASMVTYNHYYRHVIGSVGTPANLVEVEIRDFEGNVLQQGEKGEICICGPNITKGYLNNPEETKSAFWGDWFRSGDIGVIDEDGYLYIVDRLKDMIITGGENVYSREIEEILYGRPEIMECAVVGLPDREYGERVTAFIVPQKYQQIEPAALKTYLKSRLAGFKIPKEYVTVDELPKSNAGKVLKREIKKLYI